ncbi:MAG: hypothetical protein AB8H86_31650 [Polyangiales bacterium]
MSTELTHSSSDYLESIEGGLDAYGEYRVKAAVLRGMIQGHDREALTTALPIRLRPLTDPSLPATMWVPEVHATVLYLTCRDLFFASEDAFVADVLQRNLRLLDGRIYRNLVRLFAPQRIANVGRSVFNTLLHDGLKVVSVDGTPLLWKLSYPDHLVPKVIGRCYGTAIVAALKTAGHTATSELVRHGPRETLMQVRLDP